MDYPKSSNQIINISKLTNSNESILTTNIKGKDYAEVNQRIKAFRMVYPTGTIKTEMVSNANGLCIFKAEIYAEPYQSTNTTIDGVVVVDTQKQGILLGTGTAYEKEDSSYINKTSYIENCETSAVGRALAMAGFGIDTSVASAEEVQNAIAQQSITDEKAKLVAKLQELVVKTESDLDLIKKHYKVKHDVDMTVEQLNEAIKHLESKEQ